MASCTHGKPAKPVSDYEMYLLVGSYATPEEEGIKVYRFNEDTGTSQYISGLKGVSNPSYLAPSNDGYRVYAVGEDEGEAAMAHALSFEKEEGQLTLLNSQFTNGGAPCYIAANPSGRFVVTANYMGGSFTIFPVDKEGKLSAHSELVSYSGHGPVAGRQSQSHIHCVVFSPDSSFLLVTDLGTDKIHILPVNSLGPAKTPISLLDETSMWEVKVKPGSGPRHLCFHPDGKYAYLINELSGKVTVFAYDNGKLDTIQCIAADTLGAQGSADIHISPDGYFLYASNRLKGDGIAIFAVDRTNGTLSRIAYQPTGIHPRNFVITPNGNYLLVACRDSNYIQLFKIDKKTGLLKDTGQVIRTNKPVCLKFIS